MELVALIADHLDIPHLTHASRDHVKKRLSFPALAGIYNAVAKSMAFLPIPPKSQGISSSNAPRPRKAPDAECNGCRLLRLSHHRNLCLWDTQPVRVDGSLPKSSGDPSPCSAPNSAGEVPSSLSLASHMSLRLHRNVYCRHPRATMLVNLARSGFGMFDLVD
jgi:hypothetical protein